ncbi:hypothetical protein Smic_41680 [Streptomyces microflavus]|uniref:ScoMcrA-like N-terminal head domain-containing protein n=1 Tax=Streptomyces microflavus TaxID=1919 RepID=A0A7J0CT47_STRMI|nr:hypothetical protein Smic_41680 [Streptomyces microflavus]
MIYRVAMAPSEITRAGILRAIAEHDRLGPEAFRETYGYGAAVTYLLLHEGRQYDSKAIAGVAHLYDFGSALKHYQLSGGLKGAVAWLRREGFTVVEPPKTFQRRVGDVRPARRAGDRRSTARCFSYGQLGRPWRGRRACSRGRRHVTPWRR